MSKESTNTRDNHDEYLFAVRHQREALRRIEAMQQQQQYTSPTVICQVCFEEKNNSTTMVQNHNNNKFNTKHEVLHCNNQQGSYHTICYDCIASYMQEWLIENEEFVDDDTDINTSNTNNDDWKSNVICQIPCFCSSVNCNSNIIVSNWTNILSNNDVKSVWKTLTNPSLNQVMEPSPSSLSSVSLLVTYDPTISTTTTDDDDDVDDENEEEQKANDDELIVAQLVDEELNSAYDYIQNFKSIIRERNCPNCHTLLKKNINSATGLGCNAVICSFCETSVCYCCESILSSKRTTTTCGNDDDNGYKYNYNNHFLMDEITYNLNGTTKCPFFTDIESDDKEDQEVLKEEIARLSTKLLLQMQDQKKANF